ncbi:hypothetical protein CLOM_g7442 [Closterium sp. NIES-68]|nr:hypothetical protein CLOM_g7442 [Closterium sp. NIES-68]GJP81030.1 hypothetical protein CLOP_g11211 [Closterium sp. NIES-67]
MGKSLRSKRMQRLKAKKRDIAEQHYDAKEEPTRNILDAIVAAPSVYTSHVEKIAQKKATGSSGDDAEMDAEGAGNAEGAAAMDEDGKGARNKRLGVRNKVIGKTKGARGKALKGTSGGRKFSSRKTVKGKKKGLKIPKKVTAKLARKSKYPV